MIHSNRPLWLKQPPNKIDLVFFDLETTGGNPHNSSIIEIGAIKFSAGEEVGRFETLIKPRHTISPIVQKITGIKNSMVKNAPYLEDIFEDFLLFIGDAVLISHGAGADVAFFVHYKEKLFQKPFTNYYLCTHLLVSNFLPDLPAKTLTAVAEHFNFEIKYAHNALDDALMTEQVFWKLYEICAAQGFITCEDLIKIQGDQISLQKLGLGFDPAMLKNAPSMSGLFFILGSEQEIIYLSASSNLKKSLSKILEIVQENKDFQKILVDASGFKIERTPNFLDALIREKKELKRLSLPLDPRLVQKRSDKFLQILIPNDLLKYAFKNPTKVLFTIPKNDIGVSFRDGVSSRGLTAGSIEEPLDPVVKPRGDIPSDCTQSIKHTKKSLEFIKTQKYKFNRKHNGKSHVHFGYLHEGFGYAFGPFTNAEAIMPFVEELIQKYPFENQTLPLYTRSNHLIKVIQSINDFENNKYQLKSGLCVISNNEFKEFEIFVVVKSQIVQKKQLRFENAEKLKSTRYFTRLFESSYADIKNLTNPILFTDETCADIELFSHWLLERQGEGEWIQFTDLESLFDITVLD